MKYDHVPKLDHVLNLTKTWGIKYDKNNFKYIFNNEETKTKLSGIYKIIFLLVHVHKV